MGQYDSAWKDIITAHFSDFMWFYFPEIAKLFDWSWRPEFLDKELGKLHPENESPGRYADLLVKMRPRNSAVTGEMTVLLYCHVEVQGQEVSAFEARLFQYAYRIYDRFHTFPITLVVLTDNNPGFYPDSFEITTAGRYLRVEFHVAKLLYYKEKIGTLTRDSNPFAFVTFAQLEEIALHQRMRGTRKEPVHIGESEGNGGQERERKRYELKKRLSRLLYRYGFTVEYIRSLHLFLDWMIQLPRELEIELDEEITKETGGKPMPYITHWERFAMEKGLIEGRLKDKREVLFRQMNKKFSLTDEEREVISSSEDIDKLDAAIDAFVFAETKEEVLQHLS